MYIILCVVFKFKNIKFFVLKECDSILSVQMKVRNKINLKFSKVYRE